MRNLHLALAGCVLLLGLLTTGCGSSRGAAPTGSGAAGSGGSQGPAPGGTGGAVSGGAGGGASGPADSGAGDAGSGGGSPSGGAGGGAGGAGPSPVDGGGGGAAGDQYPMLKVLPLFSAPDIPTRGPSEGPPSNPSWTAPATPPTLVGGGLARHPMLYFGEYFGRIYVVNEGRVVWTFDSKGGRLDDAWMLSNGHVMYANGNWVEEITPKKEVVWHYDAPAGTVINTCQPIGLDKVLFVVSAPPQAKFVLFNKTTKAIEINQGVNAGGSLDSQFRRARMTAAGTYVGAFMALHTVTEYDKDFNAIWNFKGNWPWFAVRLKNGNTLVQDESDAAAREVSPAGQVVWELLRKSITLPAGSALDDRNQTCERLANGNTVMFGHGKGPGSVQAVEVTPNKEVVWILQDWKNLGPGTSAQFLDQPGYPEIPGQTNH